MRRPSPLILLLAALGALSIGAVFYARATRDPEFTKAPPSPLRPVEETARSRSLTMIHVRAGDQPDPGGTVGTFPYSGALAQSIADVAYPSLAARAASRAARCDERANDRAERASNLSC